MDDGVHIRVVARFRPLNEREQREMAGKEERMKVVLTKDVVDLTIPGFKHRFTFDRVYSPESEQHEVYEETARPTIDDILSGFNGTIFAYGQTGSGKTFTMMGPDQSLFTDDRGLIPRATQQLFDFIHKDTTETEYKIKCSYLEIYLEQITDLFKPEKKNLKVHETPSRGVWVSDLTEEFATCEQDIFGLLVLGGENRKTSATGMNQQSSRSHSVFIISMEQRAADGSTKTGKLNLVDLAGSEKVGKTGAEGRRLEEAKMINKSLSALGNCIHALTETGRTHVPFRDSRLTHILRDSLGGNVKTTLVLACSISEWNIQETIATMRFGERAKTIKNKAKVNKMLSAAELMKLVEQLTKDLNHWKQYAHSLEKKIAWMKSPDYDPNKEPPFETEIKALEGKSTAMEEAVDTVVALQEARAEIQRLKENAVIDLEDLKEELEFLKTHHDDSQKEMEGKDVEISAIRKDMQALKSRLEHEKEAYAVEKQQLEFRAVHSEEELAALQESFSSLSNRVQQAEYQRDDTANTKKRQAAMAAGKEVQEYVIELEGKYAAVKREVAEIEERATTDVNSVLEELNQSEAHNSELSREKGELERFLDETREAKDLASSKLALRDQEIWALRADGKTIPVELQAAINKVESQLEESSTKHLQAMQTQKQQLRKETERAVEKVTQQQEPEKISELQKELSRLQSQLEKRGEGGASGAEVGQLETEVAELRHKLQTEITKNLLMEPKLKGMERQQARLTQVEQQLIQLTKEIGALKMRIDILVAERDGLQEKLDAANSEHDDLKSRYDNMLLRPSNKIFRPALWKGTAFEAYSTELNIAELPSTLRVTQSKYLESAREESMRAQTPRGDRK